MPCGRNPAAIPRLITPHGDREQGTYQTSPQISITSSIGNALPPTAHRAPAHYPSWGSGTRFRRLSSPAGTPSFDLITPHGDRELARWKGSILPPGRPRLITPHGDREQADVRRHAGIGVVLITPHGDREPRRGTSLRVVKVVQHLITPHGDRELHYGDSVRHVERYTSSSLPLMGIGNLQRARRTYRELILGTIRRRGQQQIISLPLMGIGNRDAIQGHGSRWVEELITPHGDREQVASLQTPAPVASGSGTIQS